MCKTDSAVAAVTVEDETRTIIDRITILQKELCKRETGSSWCDKIDKAWTCCLLRSDSKWSEGNCTYRHRFTCDPHVTQERRTDSSLEKRRIQLPVGL